VHPDEPKKKKSNLKLGVEKQKPHAIREVFVYSHHTGIAIFPCMEATEVDFKPDAEAERVLSYCIAP
jgi:hypothetical protein